LLPVLEHRRQVENASAEDLQRPALPDITDQHRDVPPRGDSVVDPAPGGGHDIEDIEPDDVEPVPPCGPAPFARGSVAVFGPAKSRASVSVYALNTSARGIEGSSNHDISIPLINASISTALTVAS